MKEPTQLVFARTGVPAVNPAPGRLVDLSENIYKGVLSYLEEAGLGRGPVDRHKRATRATQVAFCRLVGELEVDEIALEIGTSPRTVDNSLRDLRRSLRRPDPRPRSTPRERHADLVFACRS